MRLSSFASPFVAALRRRLRDDAPALPVCVLDPGLFRDLRDDWVASFVEVTSTDEDAFLGGLPRLFWDGAGSG